MSNLEEEYLRDKKYIHSTLDSAVENIKDLHTKFDAFKLSISTSIVVIQTKLAIYVAGASILTAGAVQSLTMFIKGE